MALEIKYKCPKNITSFSQCTFPDGVTHVTCDNNDIKSFQYLPESVIYISCRYNHITSFKYLPRSVSHIWCSNNQIESFKYLPGSVTDIWCAYNQINSFKYLPESVRCIACADNQITSFQYLPGSVSLIYCGNNPCHAKFISKGLPQIHQKNMDMIAHQVCRWKLGIEKLRYMRLNYLLHSLWERYWYDHRDIQGYSRACKHLAAKNCPNGFLSIT